MEAPILNGPIIGQRGKWGYLRRSVDILHKHHPPPGQTINTREVLQYSIAFHSTHLFTSITNSSQSSSTMDYNQGLDFSHQTQEEIWVDEINRFRMNGGLCEWVASFHPDEIPCRLDGGFLNGSYNVGPKFIFDDGTAWLLRFPRVKSVSPNYADEKVAMEVEALSLIRERTSVPVPEIRAWGLADANPLGLGPFILMEFIDGVCLNDLFTGGGSRLLKKEISDSDLGIVYRQIANFMLQIFEINFQRIGSLPTTRTGYSTPARPLTWKVQEILQTGGVNTFGAFGIFLSSSISNDIYK